MPGHIGDLVGAAYITNVDSQKQIAYYRLMGKKVPECDCKAPFSIFSQTPNSGESYRCYVIGGKKPRTVFEHLPVYSMTPEEKIRIARYEGELHLHS